MEEQRDKQSEDLVAAYTAVFQQLKRKRFPQQHLMDANGFRTFASGRGLTAHFEELEHCERETVLWPVILCPRLTSFHRVTRRYEDGRVDYDPTPLETGVEDDQDTVEILESFDGSAELLQGIEDGGRQLLPNILERRPWSEERYPDTKLPTMWRYYHPYQVFRLREVEELLRQSSLVICGSVDWFWDLQAEEGKKHWPERLSRLRESLPQNYRDLAVLVALEDRYLPQVRGVLRYHTAPGQDRAAWHEWRQQFDPHGLLTEVGRSVEQVASLREGLAIRGDLLDPNRTLYPLLRMLTFAQRDKLRGKARLAWDYYEAADVLGMFLKDLTGERQPHIDDLVRGGGQWKKAVFGFAPHQFDYGNARVRASIARHYGVDAQPRLLWVVEGETEEEFVSSYCQMEGIDLSAEGIEFRGMRGLNKWKNPVFHAYVGRVRDRQAALLVTVDGGDSGARDLARTLKQMGLVGDPIAARELDEVDFAYGVLLWQPCFESDNFTPDLLFEAWLLSTRNQPMAPLSHADTDSLREGLAERLRCRGGQPADALTAVAGFVKDQGYVYRKPLVGRHLPAAIDTARRRGQIPRPLSIETLIRKSISIAHRLLTGRFHY